TAIVNAQRPGLQTKPSGMASGMLIFGPGKGGDYPEGQIVIGIVMELPDCQARKNHGELQDHQETPPKGRGLGKRARCGFSRWRKALGHVPFARRTFQIAYVQNGWLVTWVQYRAGHLMGRTPAGDKILKAVQAGPPSFFSLFQSRKSFAQQLRPTHA